MSQPFHRRLATGASLLGVFIGPTPIHAPERNATGTAADSSVFIRINQVGYLPDAPKVAVVCALENIR